MHRIGTRARLVLAGAVLFSLTSLASANPFANLFSFDRVEADPNKHYPLQETHGPWLILAATFSGDQAGAQAHALVLELRKRYKMNAYLHHQKFEESMDDVGIRLPGDRGRFRYLKPTNEAHSEYAVLVGDFTSVEDPRLKSTLNQIKTIKPDCLNPHRHDRPSTQTFVLWRTTFAPNADDTKGPMNKAFAIPNPMVKLNETMRGVVDSFIVNLNRDNRYNLLDNPRRYTLRVATFDGNYVWAVGDRQLRQYEAGVKRFDSHLEDAGKAAAKLCEALRIMGYEAYEFHDRNCSMVTIGSWDSLGVEGADGRIILDPEIVKLIDRFQAKPAPNPIPGHPSMIAERLPSLPLIPFDNQPRLVEVPRKSVAAQYRPSTAAGSVRRVF